MRDSAAKYQEHHADDSPGDNAYKSMAAKSHREGNNTDGQDDDEHLHMKMSFTELAQKGQYRYEYGQGEAMQQAQARQCDSRIVQET